MKKLRGALLVPFVAALVGSFEVTARPAALPPACRELLHKALPGWSLSQPDPDAAAWAARQRINPAVISGDFDGDGQRDWAALVTASGNRHALACLTRKPGKQLLTVAPPTPEIGCSDLLLLAKRGTLLNNLDTDRPERVKRDAIMLSCFEKASTTYVYSRGRFRGFTSGD